MEISKFNNKNRYLNAKKKVKAIKGFYWHLAVYIVINSFTTINKVIRNVYENGETYMEAVWDINIFFIWGPWGLGLLIHGLVVFDIFSFVLGKNWQERKIREYMDDDDKERRITNKQDSWE